MPPRRQAGHRQKGAGTVVSSRGDQMRQGLLLKEWQRTPMQLLQQYCQSKKRINARYVHARCPEGRFRMRCILPDDKSSAKDLAFCPEQDFDSMEDAKHCAALLALRHVEPLRPLERQLPEPYDKLWLALVKEIAPGGSQGATQPQADAKKSARKAPTNKKDEPLKTKTETKQQQQQTTEEKGMDLWANAPPDEDDDEPNKKPTKALPMEITSDRKFASHAEFEKAKLEKAQQRNVKQRARENRERANPYKHVLMGAACREMIEGVLKNLSASSAGMASNGGDGGEDADGVAGAGASVPDDHEALFAKVTKQLKGIGFQTAQISGALRACRWLAYHSDDDDAYMTDILDWLCLNVPEGELPKGFNPEGTQLDVVVVESKNKNEASSPLASVLVQRLMKLGYDRRDAGVVVRTFLESPAARSLDVQNDAPSDVMVLSVVRSAMPLLLNALSLSSSATTQDVPSDPEELSQMQEDEMFALEAIYDDKLTQQTLVNGDRVLVIQIGDDGVQLEMLLSKDCKYPFEFPSAIAVVCKDAASASTTSHHQKYQPAQLLNATAQALRTTHSSLGDPLIYDLCVSVESALNEPAKNKSSDRIVLLKHEDDRKKKKPLLAPPPAPTSASAPSKSKKHQQRNYNNNNSKRGPQFSRQANPAQIKQLSDRLLSQRKAKDRHNEFQQMLRARARLPAATEKQSVLQYMVHHQVLLVCGATGCGKTTQIPQFILDEYVDSGRGGECNIICTQPRRIAAIGVATRVAQERCEEIADVVGYQIRMDAKKSANTRLLFCTTGVLLRRLLTDRSLSGISHVIVDEVHERNVDTDFLLSILRDLLPQRPDLRLILMSATMNAQLFVNYFSSGNKQQAPCPVLDIPGFTFPVQDHFLEDVLAKTAYQVPKKMLVEKKKKAAPTRDGGAPDESSELSKPVSSMSISEIVKLIDDSRIDYDLCAHVVKYVADQNEASDGTSNGAILVFLPGTAEIKRLTEMLSPGGGRGGDQSSSKLWVLPLHGSLSGADQAQVFKSPPKGKTKVIIATNIAETSITINDITAVIDCGKVKEMVYDSQLRRSQLLDCWASQAACDQRRGRAGRVQAGTCYRLFSRARFAKMAAQLSAEIHRVSLEQLCLQIKKLELGPIRGFLAKAIEPPKQEAIDAAMQELVAIAAFKPVKENEANITNLEEEEVTLTPLGSHLAMLPLDARIGKFLIYGSILRCIDPVATIAACISSKSPFVMAMNDPEAKQRQDTLKKELGGGLKSDHLLLARLVLDRYAGLHGQKAKRGFCKDYALSFDTLETISELRAQYLQQLDAIGFYESHKKLELNANADVPRIVKAALCAGLYANVIQVVYPDQKYFQSAHGVLTEDHDAKKIRYFVRANVAPEGSNQPAHLVPRERVFLHPSSTNFTQTQYDSPWLLFTELVQTSKVFVRESTMVNPYALLLFGGKLDVHHEQNVLSLDGFIKFNAVARIGVLIKAIRRHLDELLTQKIAQPELDIAQSELVTAIGVLLKTEGM